MSCEDSQDGKRGCERYGRFLDGYPLGRSGRAYPVARQLAQERRILAKGLAAMNQRLAAILALLEQCNRDLAKSTANYKATNDKFALWVNRWAPKGGKLP